MNERSQVFSLFGIQLPDMWNMTGMTGPWSTPCAALSTTRGVT